MNFTRMRKTAIIGGHRTCCCPTRVSTKFVTTGSTDVEHIDRLLHGTWRAKLSGNLSAIGWHNYRKTTERELSVNLRIMRRDERRENRQLTSVQHEQCPMRSKRSICSTSVLPVVTTSWKRALGNNTYGVPDNCSLSHSGKIHRS